MVSIISVEKTTDNLLYSELNISKMYVLTHRCAPFLILTLQSIATFYQVCVPLHIFLKIIILNKILSYNEILTSTSKL